MSSGGSPWNADSSESTQWLRVNVAGRNGDLWKKLKPALIEKMQALLDSVIDEQRNTTVRDEMKDLTSRFLDFAKAKLGMPGAELAKEYAEVAKLYAERRREVAQADKVDAEAAAIRMTTRIKEFRLALGMTKAIMIGDSDDEAFLFGQQIDAMLLVLKEVADTPRA